MNATQIAAVVQPATVGLGDRERDDAVRRYAERIRRQALAEAATVARAVANEFGPMAALGARTVAMRLERMT
jgi:hypothetical protein